MRFLIIYLRYVKWQREFFKVFKKEKFTESKRKNLRETEPKAKKYEPKKGETIAAILGYILFAITIVKLLWTK